jgi:hypothetical protein
VIGNLEEFKDQESRPGAKAPLHSSKFKTISTCDAIRQVIAVFAPRVPVADFFSQAFPHGA